MRIKEHKWKKKKDISKEKEKKERKKEKKQRKTFI